MLWLFLGILECTYLCLMLPRYKFRANPINPKIFNKNGLFGVPKRPADQANTTVPESPLLATKERMESRKRKHEEGENPANYEFHAQPILKGILEGVKVISCDCMCH